MINIPEREEGLTMPKLKGNHWDSMQNLGWAVGDSFEAVSPGRDGTPTDPEVRQTCKLVRITSTGGQPLLPNGKYDVPANSAMAGRDGTAHGIVTFCEWPIGGKVAATSLSCREWRKIA